MTFRDFCLAVFTIFLWSTSLIVQKIGVNYISIYALNVIRLTAAIPLLLFFYRGLPKSFLRYAMCAFFWNTIGPICIGFALKLGAGAGMTSFLTQLNVFFAIFFCFLLLGERPRWVEMAGMGVAFCGVYLITKAGLEAPGHTSFIGVFLILCYAAAWGFAFTLLKKFKIGAHFEDNLWLSVFAIPQLFGVQLFMEGPHQALVEAQHLSLIGITCSLYVGAISTLLGSYFWFNLAQRSSAAAQAPFMLLLPLFTCLLSVVFLGEQLTGFQIGAGALIVLGVCLAHSLNLFKGAKMKTLFNVLKQRMSHG